MNYIIPKIHREGYFFISIFAIVSVIFANIVMALGIIGFILTVWCIYFFRDPERVTPDNENLVISPADGVIQKIAYVVPPSELELGDEEMLRISVFLSVFNVHVNRSAVTGVVTKLYYHPGKFLNASLDKASEDNERQSVVVETNSKVKVGFVQIAGLIARRIVCDLHEGDQLKAGQRFGIIRFGSRMDVFLPKDINPLVFEGQIAVAGETIFADLTNSYPVNTGEIR